MFYMYVFYVDYYHKHFQGNTYLFFQLLKSDLKYCKRNSQRIQRKYSGEFFDWVKNNKSISTFSNTLQPYDQYMTEYKQPAEKNMYTTNGFKNINDQKTVFNDPKESICLTNSSFFMSDFESTLSFTSEELNNMSTSTHVASIR